MDYTIENLRRQFPELARASCEDIIPLFDASVNLWLQQFQESGRRSNSPITDFEDLGCGNYRFVIGGSLVKLRVNLEDRSVYDPDTSLYMATKLSFEGEKAGNLAGNLEEFIRHTNLGNLERVASEKFRRYMTMAD